MSRKIVLWLACLMLGGALVSMPTAAHAGTTPITKNCGAGKAVVLHWHNKNYGYVDVWTGFTAWKMRTPPSNYYKVGNHSWNTGASRVRYGYGTGALRHIDKQWATCSSAF